MKTELVGYVRKSNGGNSLKVQILKSSMDNAIVNEANGTEYVSLIIDIKKLKMILGDEKEITNVCQVLED